MDALDLHAQVRNSQHRDRRNRDIVIAATFASGSFFDRPIYGRQFFEEVIRDNLAHRTETTFNDTYDFDVGRRLAILRVSSPSAAASTTAC